MESTDPGRHNWGGASSPGVLHGQGSGVGKAGWAIRGKGEQAPPLGNLVGSGQAWPGPGTTVGWWAGQLGIRYKGWGLNVQGRWYLGKFTSIWALSGSQGKGKGKAGNWNANCLGGGTAQPMGITIIGW